MLRDDGEAPPTVGRDPYGPDTTEPGPGTEPAPGPSSEPGSDFGPGPNGSAALPRAEAVAAARAAVRQARARHLAAERRTREAVPRPVPEVGSGDRPRVRAKPGPGLVPRTGRGEVPGTEPHAEEGPEEGASWRTRLSAAVRERLPLWVQTRCGVEPRSLAALTLVLALALGFAVHHFWTGRPQPVQAPPVEPAARSHPAPPSVPPFVPPPGLSAASASGGGALVVDVAGEVRSPGVHRLPSGARVADALRAAGGVRPGTDLGGLNRARLVVDGEQIVVGETPAAAAVPAVPVGSGGPGGTVGGGPAGGPVSLSSATLEQLDALPGIGPVLAQHIIAYRTEHGGFSSVEQLREVDGIGERRFADLQPLVVP